MKKLLICALAACSLFACGSKEEISKGDKELSLPCDGPEYQSDSKTFRAWAQGYSTDMNIARNKALTVARAELATQISATIKRVTDNYSSSYQTGVDEEAKARFQDMVRVVVEQKLSGTRVICNKMFETKDGKYRSVVVVELGADDLAIEIQNKVSDEDKMRIDYEYEKFKEVFENEMRNNK